MCGATKTKRLAGAVEKKKAYPEAKRSEPKKATKAVKKSRPPTFTNADALRCTCKACKGECDPFFKGDRPVGSDEGWCPACTREYGEHHFPMNARGEPLEPVCRCKTCKIPEPDTYDSDAEYEYMRKADLQSSWPHCELPDGDDEPCPDCIRVDADGSHVCFCDACGGKCADADGKPCGDCVFLDGKHVELEDR